MFPSKEAFGLTVSVITLLLLGYSCKTLASRFVQCPREMKCIVVCILVFRKILKKPSIVQKKVTFIARNIKKNQRKNQRKSKKSKNQDQDHKTKIKIKAKPKPKPKAYFPALPILNRDVHVVLDNLMDSQLSGHFILFFCWLKKLIRLRGLTINFSVHSLDFCPV